MKFTARKIAFSGLIAAVYAVVTILLSFSSYGVIQFRVAEAMTILPFFSPVFIPGLFIGCLLSNMFSPNGMLDLIFGSLATLLAAVLTYYIGRTNIKFKRYLAPFPAVIVNAIVVGALLHYTINYPLLISILQVGFGEAVCCYGLGLPLLLFIEKNDKLKKYFM